MLPFCFFLDEDPGVGVQVWPGSYAPVRDREGMIQIVGQRLSESDERRTKSEERRARAKRARGEGGGSQALPKEGEGSERRKARAAREQALGTSMAPPWHPPVPSVTQVPQAH